jgi:hypothetical protein
MRVLSRSVLVIGSAIALAGAVVIAGGGDDPATVETEVPTGAPAQAGGDVGLPDGGVIRLRIEGTGGSAGDNWFRFDEPDGSGGYTAGTPAPITERRCQASTSGVMAVASTPAPSQGRVGLVDTGLGVVVKGEGQGTPCGRVDGTGQALTLTPDVGASAVFDFAELDVEAKGGATLRAELRLGGALQATETIATGGPDSGPDSADGDNFRWRVPSVDGPTVYFDEIVLRVDPSTPTAAFSLEGGGDGTAPEPGGLGDQLATTDTLFHLVDADGVLDCGDAVSAGGGDVPQADLVRLENLLGDPDDCVAIPYALRPGLEGETQTVLLAKVLGGQEELEPAFTLDITWLPEPAAYPIARTTSIDDGSGPVPLVWCDGTVSAPELPAGVNWCLTGQSAEPAGVGLIQVSESLYGAGDPRFRR